MRLLLDLDNNITSLNSWEFISFSMVNIFFTIRSSLINLDFNDLLFLDNLLTVTGLTFVLFINHLSLSIAFVTRASSLGIHTRSKHLHNCSHTFTFTSAARLDSSRFTSLAFTFTTNAVSVNSYL